MVSHPLHVLRADWLFLFNVYMLVVFPSSYWLVLHVVSIHELVHVFCSLLPRARIAHLGIPTTPHNTTPTCCPSVSASYTTFSP